jgi:hypothetical protein
VNLEKAFAVHFFPSCKSRELGVETTQQPQISTPYIRMKGQYEMDRWEIPHMPA